MKTRGYKSYAMMIALDQLMVHYAKLYSRRVCCIEYRTLDLEELI